MSGTVDTPYLGSRISLISKAKIRYEGILYAIDTENMTVALTKVRSFGTEDRNPERPVPPRDETFEYIIFRGTDIFDLTVCDLPQDRLPQDPAILTAAQQPPAPIGTSQPQPPGYFQAPAQPVQSPFGRSSPPSATSPAQDANQNKDRRDSGAERDRRNNRSYNQERRGNQNRQAGNWNQQNRQSNRDNRDRNDRNSQANKQPTKFDGDYNFEEANAEFEKLRKDLDQKLKISLGVNKDKNEETAQAENEEEPVELESGEIPEEDPEEQSFYNKSSSFFDNISCEANDPQGERITRSAERKLNSETFGIPMNRQFGRGRGRGGGRGGWRGGGRNNYRGGGHNNYHNNRSNHGNWRQGHDNRTDNRNNRNDGNERQNNWRDNNRGGGGGGRGGGHYHNRNNRDMNSHWRGGGNNAGGGGHPGGYNRGGYHSRGRGGYQNRNNQNQDGGDMRNNRNNKNREWVDYEYDVSKAREKTQAQS